MSINEYVTTPLHIGCYVTLCAYITIKYISNAGIKYFRFLFLFDQPTPRNEGVSIQKFQEMYEIGVKIWFEINCKKRCMQLD